MSDLDRWMHDVDRLADNPGDWTGEAWQDEQPTPEEQAQEAAYYAHLEAQMKQAVVVPDPVNFVDDDDDGGYCGPTCGKYGNW